MADFVAVLKKTIDGLADNTPDLRQRVYAKARETVAAKLAAITPAPPQVAVERQHKALEEAIAAVEAGYVAAAEPQKADDFDSVLAELSAAAPPAAVPSPPSPRAAPPATGPASGSAAASPLPPRPAPLPPRPAPVVRPAPVTPSLRPVAPVLRPEQRTVAAAPAAMPVPDKAGAQANPSAAPEASAPAARSGRLDTPPELVRVEDRPELAPVEAAPRPVPALPRATFPAGDPDTAAASSPRPRRRIGGGLVAAALALVVIGGGGYGVWLNRDAFADLFGLGGNVVESGVVESGVAEGGSVAPQPEQPAAEAEPAPQEEEEAPVEIAAVAPDRPADPAEGARSLPAVQKFTQRLHSDGTETDPGPAGGQPRVGEGTTLAAATVGAEQTATEAGPAQPAAAGSEALQVGQRAIFYEERTSIAEGSADDGATVWSLVQESPGADQPPEPAVRAEVSIPSRDLAIRMTIRRNADPSLPASHIVEMIFITSGTFEGGGVESVLRIAFKSSEAAPGAALIGIPAKIADGYFLVALSDNAAESNQNTQLMLREPWIDIPIVYRSGRRALLTMEKGIPGAKAFEDAIRAWQASSAG